MTDVSVSRQIRKATFVVEVLYELRPGERDYDPSTLSQVAYDIDQGDCIGTWRLDGVEDVPESAVSDELVAIGNDGSFFGTPESAWLPEPGGTITVNPVVRRVFAYELMPADLRSKLEAIGGVDDQTLLSAARHDGKERGYLKRIVGETNPRWLVARAADEVYARGLIDEHELDRLVAD